MPDSETELRLIPSVLDRLTDLDPEVTREPAASSLDNLRQMKESLCADLDALLNTRRSENEIPREFAHSNTSLLAYGLPDFTALGLANPSEQDRLRRAIERAIRVFEPRLSRVSVSLRPKEELALSLRFRVDALLNVEPAPAPVAFDTVLRADSGKFEVSGDAR